MERGTLAAEPLWNKRVSWGAILSGALMILAIALILWALGLAVVATVWRAHVDTARGPLLALGIIAICTTWVGAFFGGMFAGYLTGSPRRIIEVLHAIMAWALAFLIATSVQFSFLRAFAGAQLSAQALLNWLTGIGWVWFGTWFIGFFLAVAGGGAVRARLERDVEQRERRRMGPPFEPTPSPV